MVTMTLGRTVGHGALAGAVAGGFGAAAQYWLAEPSIRAAIAIEGAAEKASAAGAHTQGAADHASGHSHVGEALMSRGEQVVIGMITVLLIGILIGIAFALVHRFLGTRLPGSTAAGSAMALAGLGFISFTLAPAIAISANPPAVGDPATVNLRTLTYLATILCSVAVTAMVIRLSRAKGLAPGSRAVVAAAVGIGGTAALLWALPDPASVPANVPADLIWKFRIGSLTELGLMWLFLGATFGWLSTSREPKRAVVPPAISTHA